jgi:hypothetical protein
VYNLKRKEKIMSNLNNDFICDRAISDAIDIVDEMSDTKVKQVLHLNFGINIPMWKLNLDEARDFLISRISEQLLEESA